MAKRNKVQKSVNRLHYIELREDGMSFQDLSDEAGKLGEKISAMAFWRYFNEVYNPELEAMLHTPGVDPGLEGAKQKRVIILNEINTNLTNLQHLTNTILATNPTDHKTISAVTGLIRETRLTLDYLDKRLKAARLDETAVQSLDLDQFLLAIEALPSKCPRCGNDLGLMDLLKDAMEEDTDGE